MAISPNDLKIYLTGIAVDGSNYDGGSEQSSPNSSLGGFRSSTVVNGSSLLSATVTSSATTIQVDDISEFPGASAVSPAFAVIGEEIVSYTGRSSTVGSGSLIGVTRGLLGRVATSHAAGEIVTAMSSQNLFDHVRASENADGKTEYRCMAVLNTNTSDTAYNVSVFLSPVKFGGTADSATASTLKDAALVGEYEDDYFNGGTLVITGGTGYTGVESSDTYDILDYKDSTGVFTISGSWSSTTPNATTTYIAESTKASPNVNNTVSFCIERHKYSVLDGAGVATDGGVNYLTDSNLIGAGYTDINEFIGCYLLLLTGNGVDGVPKRITSYNNSTGKISVNQNFVNSGVSSGDTYAILRGPTDVLVSGEDVSPAAGVDFISAFSSATTLDDALSINVNNAGEDLLHDELFFIWIRRVIAPNTDGYVDDNIVPVINFES